MPEVKVEGEVRDLLSIPYGGVCSPSRIVEIAKESSRKIVSVGDAVLLSFLEIGVKPFVAVYDFRTLREDIAEERREVISKAFPQPYIAKNSPSTFNTDILAMAKPLMEKGGALRVEGEEDISGLAFMYYATREHLICYGIKDKGVIVVPGEQAHTIASYIMGKMGLTVAP